jgi:two-component system NtrC family response regulator
MATGHSLRVLVVDDELLLRWSLSEVLRSHGHTVVEAASASTCREAMEDGEPIDVVLLDVRLPDSQTLDLLTEIRSRRPQAAVVLMTAYGAADVVENALALGASCVITKPFDMNAIEDLVQRAHRNARLH